MKSLLKPVLACSVLMAGAPAMADNGINYSFIELHYVDLEEDNIDGDGLAFGGSYRLSSKVYIRGEYQDLEIENVDVELIEIGAGYIHPVNKLDLVGEVNYVDVDSDASGGDDDGLVFAGGVRTYLTPKVEGRASLNHTRLGDNDTFVQLGASYDITNAFALDGTFDVGGDVDILTFGVRYSF